jgi:hypothetical protein
METITSSSTSPQESGSFPSSPNSSYSSSSSRQPPKQFSCLNCYDYTGLTPLMIAVDNNQPDIVSLLLLQRELDWTLEPATPAQPEILSPFLPYCNALFRAVVECRKEIVEIFVKQSWVRKQNSIHNTIL